MVEVLMPNSGEPMVLMFHNTEYSTEMWIYIYACRERVVKRNFRRNFRSYAFDKAGDKITN